MQPRSFALIGAAAFTLGACGDSPTDPDLGPLTEVVLDLCGTFDFEWMGYQNAGQPWRELTPSIEGTVTFDATDKVSIALVTNFFGSSITEVVNATAEELAALGASGVCEEFGNRAILGSVTNLNSEESVNVYGEMSSTIAASTFPNWELTDLPDDGVVDLVATRAASPNTSPPNRVIVRRGITPNPNGIPIAALDFNSEGLPLEHAVLTVGNLGEDFLILESAVRTGNGTLATLGQLGGSAANQISYVSLPATFRTDADMHSLWLRASSAEGDREAFHYYKAPASKSITLGPVASEPTISQLGTTPYLRLRLDLPSQPEYPSAAGARFFHAVNQFSYKLVAVTTTAGFVGSTPTTWRLEIPEFGNSGYESSWGLESGSFDWGVAALNGDMAVALGAAPSDGETLLIGSRFSESQFLQEAAYSGRGSGAFSRFRSGIMGGLLKTGTERRPQLRR